MRLRFRCADPTAPDAHPIIAQVFDSRPRMAQLLESLEDGAGRGTEDVGHDALRDRLWRTPSDARGIGSGWRWMEPSVAARLLTTTPDA